MRKRLTFFLLCFFMCVAMVPVSARAVETAEANAPAIPVEGDVWDGSITQPTKLVQKDGVYYYEITKCSELAYVAQTGGEWLEYSYILGNNLILNDTPLTWDKTGSLTNTEILHEWTPIENFSGLLDGNGYCVSGLVVLNPNSSYQGLFGYLSGNLQNLKVLNAHVEGSSYVGGIVGEHYRILKIKNCVFSGVVKGKNYVGGIVGKTHQNNIINCAIYGFLYGADKVGGIAGHMSATSIADCRNYADVIGNNNVGGIIGYLTSNYGVNRCINRGSITGETYVGGIAGFLDWLPGIEQCSNEGTITGGEYVGGIVGMAEGSSGSVPAVKNCYNTAHIYADQYCGGIIGNSLSANITFCYNVGSATASENVGMIAGYSDCIWGKGSVSSCYYKMGEIIGVGNLTNDDGKTIAATLHELKIQMLFEKWNFTSIWSISTEINNGYPYLRWQESLLSYIPTNGISLDNTLLQNSVGDSAYLTATVSPANASNKSVIWKSSDSDTVTVSAAGKVTAVSAGTAIITATTVDGGYTASCTVTVTDRLAEEYRINSITVRDNDGAVLSAIPSDSCLATVSITNLASEGNTLVFLAAYTSTGQYQGMMWVSVEDLPIGATIRVTLPVDNSNGKIANLKAFTVASFSNLTPLGEAVSFLP